jgi:hypothetical protein
LPDQLKPGTGPFPKAYIKFQAKAGACMPGAIRDCLNEEVALMLKAQLRKMIPVKRKVLFVIR